MTDANSKTTNFNRPTNPIALAIVGGGISGLAVALGLLSRAPNLHLHIFEAAPAFSEIGAGVAFGPNALRALSLLHPEAGAVYERLRTSNADDSRDECGREVYLRVVMGMDRTGDGGVGAGREVCVVRGEGGLSSVHRARLLEAIAALLPEAFMQDNVTFNARLTASSMKADGIDLTFSNDKTYSFDAAIDCTGIKSPLRTALLGPGSKPVFTGKYAYRGLIPMHLATAALCGENTLNGAHRVGYDGHVLTFPIDHGRTLNVVAFRTHPTGRWEAGAEWIQPASKEAMKADFAGWGEEVQKLIGMMEKCDRWALFDHPAADSYHDGKGRFCLMGDAAHASTPHMGAGAGMAVEDAVVLSSLLGEVREKGDLGAAFGAFEAVRKDRTQRLVRESRRQAELYEFQGEGVADDVEELRKVLPSRWEWIWGYDMDAAIEEAKGTFRREMQASKGYRSGVDKQES